MPALGSVPSRDRRCERSVDCLYPRFLAALVKKTQPVFSKIDENRIGFDTIARIGSCNQPGIDRSDRSLRREGVADATRRAGLAGLLILGPLPWVWGRRRPRVAWPTLDGFARPSIRTAAFSGPVPWLFGGAGDRLPGRGDGPAAVARRAGPGRRPGGRDRGPGRPELEHEGGRLPRRRAGRPPGWRRPRRRSPGSSEAGATTWSAWSSSPIIPTSTPRRRSIRRSCSRPSGRSGRPGRSTTGPTWATPSPSAWARSATPRPGGRS